MSEMITGIFAVNKAKSDNQQPDFSKPPYVVRMSLPPTEANRTIRAATRSHGGFNVEIDQKKSPNLLPDRWKSLIITVYSNNQMTIPPDH